jgi:hypothetical protein
MTFFPLSGVLRGFPVAAYRKYASPETPVLCAALLNEKMAHL